VTHKSSPYMKRYRLPSLKIASSNVGRSQYYDGFSSPEEEQSEKILSQILKLKGDISDGKCLESKDISNNYIEKSSPSLTHKKEEEKIVKNLESKCNNNNNNNNQGEPIKIEIDEDSDNKKIKEIQMVIQNEVMNLEKRFKELEILMKF
uniref:Uncharacterized protein n=1 Tax=Strongyloides stercoralis TaxID=6248 RepID=A0AAF5DFA2_STRER